MVNQERSAQFPFPFQAWNTLLGQIASPPQPWNSRPKGKWYAPDQVPAQRRHSHACRLQPLVTPCSPVSPTVAGGAEELYEVRRWTPEERSLHVTCGFFSKILTQHKTHSSQNNIP